MNKQKIVFYFLILLTLTACSDRARPPPVPDGAYFQINPTRWQNQVAVRP